MSEDYYKARISELERELEAANAENVRLSGKSGCCLECERLARENEKLRSDLTDWQEKWEDEYRRRSASEMQRESYLALINKIKEEIEIELVEF